MGKVNGYPRGIGLEYIFFKKIMGKEKSNRLF